MDLFKDCKSLEIAIKNLRSVIKFTVLEIDSRYKLNTRQQAASQDLKKIKDQVDDWIRKYG